MAKKRNTGTEPGVSGTATARERIRRAPATARAPRSPEPSASSAPREPSPDEIARLAYQYWESRGGRGGDPEDDWLRAEQELRQARR